jgi:hypothetical protein
VAKYLAAFNAHCSRGVAQGYKPLRFDQFVSLAQHLEA